MQTNGEDVSEIEDAKLAEERKDIDEMTDPVQVLEEWAKCVETIKNASLRLSLLGMKATSMPEVTVTEKLTLNQALNAIEGPNSKCRELSDMIVELLIARRHILAKLEIRKSKTGGIKSLFDQVFGGEERPKVIVINSVEELVTVLETLRTKCPCSNCVKDRETKTQESQPASAEGQSSDDESSSEDDEIVEGSKAFGALVDLTLQIPPIENA